MLYLAIAVFVSSLVPTILKYSRKNQLDVNYIIVVNYFFAAASSGIAAYRNGLFNGFYSISKSNILRMFSEITQANTYLLILIFGIFSGILYYFALMITRYSVMDNGMGTTSMFSRLSFLLPLVVSMLVWHEVPSVISTIGMIAGVLSLVIMMSTSFFEKKHIKIGMLVLLLFANGVVELNNKVVVTYSVSPAYKSLFVCIIYGVALLVSGGFLILTTARNKMLVSIRPEEQLLGVVLGLQNVLYSFLLLKALEVLPAALVYATTASGGVLMSSAIGILIFKESVTQRQKCAIIMTICSLILINIG